MLMLCAIVSAQDTLVSTKKNKLASPEKVIIDNNVIERFHFETNFKQKYKLDEFVYEVKLKEIYSNYQLALNHVSIIISQYEDHKRSVRKLVKQHKSYKKAIKGKNAFNIKFESF